MEPTHFYRLMIGDANGAVVVQHLEPPIRQVTSTFKATNIRLRLWQLNRA